MKLGIRAKVAIGGIVGLLTCGTVLVWHASQPIVDDQPESGFSKVQAASSASPVDKGSASVGSQDTGATEERVDALFNELREQVEPMDDGSKEQISEGTSQPRATKAVDTSAGTEEAEAPGEEMSREERLHEIETKLLRLAGEYREVMHRRNNLEAAPGTHARSTEFNRLQDIRRQIHNEMLVLAAQYNQLAPGTMGSGFFARLTEGILNFVPIPIEEGLRLRDQL